MANELNFSFRDESTKRLRIYDFSYAYSGVNLGGYGSPNYNASDITACTMSIKMSNGVTYSGINIYQASVFPSVTGGSILLTDAEIGGELVDGLAEVTVVATGTSSGTPFTIQGKFLLYITAKSRCCVQKLGAAIKVAEDCCSSTENKAFLKGYNYLTQLEYLAKECCNFAKADEILAQLQLHCQSSGCTTC
ncbi:MAG: hypothetical protein ACO1HP_06500 [Bacteroidota bacterium]